MQTKWRSRLMQLVFLLDRESAEARGTGYAALSARRGRSVPQVLMQELRESLQQAEVFRNYRRMVSDDACDVEAFRETA